MKIWITLLSFIICIPSIYSQTKDEIYEVFEKCSIHHKDIVYAQILLETGNLKSIYYKRSNNLFGIMEKNRLKRYNHWSESIKDYKRLIQRRHRKGENYYSFLVRIRYAKDKRYIKKLKTHESFRKKQNKD